MRRMVLSAVFAAALSAPACADDAMHQAADGFYGVYQTLHVSGIPDSGDLVKFAPHLSPALQGLLAQGAASQERYFKANKGSPPLVEGDLFSSLFEGATAAGVGACTGDSDKGQCAVALSYADRANTTNWTDTVYLVNTPSGWRVDDIGYGGTWAFGNKGRLSETLRQAIAFGQ